MISRKDSEKIQKRLLLKRLRGFQARFTVSFKNSLVSFFFSIFRTAKPRNFKWSYIGKLEPCLFQVFIFKVLEFSVGIEKKNCVKVNWFWVWISWNNCLIVLWQFFILRALKFLRLFGSLPDNNCFRMILKNSVKNG